VYPRNSLDFKEFLGYYEGIRIISRIAFSQTKIFLKTPGSLHSTLRRH